MDNRHGPMFVFYASKGQFVTDQKGIAATYKIIARMIALMKRSGVSAQTAQDIERDVIKVIIAHTKNKPDL